MSTWQSVSSLARGRTYPASSASDPRVPDAGLVNGGAPITTFLQRCHAAITECLLERSPQAVILVDSKGTIGGLNGRAKEILGQGDGLIIRHGILRCRHQEDTSALHRLICNEATTPRGLAIRRPVGRRALTALVTALHGNDPPESRRSVVAVLVNDPEDAQALDAQMLRAWYGLTPAEGRVAVLLAGGLSLAGIVDCLGIGSNTARTHLKNIFAKTNTCRQGELIRLLLSNPALASVSISPGTTVGMDLQRNRPAQV